MFHCLIKTGGTFWWITATPHPLETPTTTFAMIFSSGEPHFKIYCLICGILTSRFSVYLVVILFFLCEKLWERPPDDCLWKREEPDGPLRLWSLPLCEAQEPENVHCLPPLRHQVVSSRRLPSAHARETDAFTHHTKHATRCKTCETEVWKCRFKIEPKRLINKCGCRLLKLNLTS